MTTKTVSAKAAEPVEAVIISGPRRGEIVRLPDAPPAEASASDIEEAFSELAGTWRRETAAMSVIAKKAMHPAYQRIIGLGKPAIPLILNELKQRSGHWFWALHAITGEDPVLPGDSFDAAADAWLAWGRERGYIT